MPTSLNAPKKPSPPNPKTLLKPGLAISLVVHTDIKKEIYDIRTSTLHDMDGKKLIIAQPDPALLTALMNKVILISFLTDEKANPVRYGFQARIIDFIKEYQLSSSQTAPAIVVQQKSIPEHYNLRMFFRIQPPSNSGFQITVYDQPLGIINISIGGALISATHSQSVEFKFEIGKTIKVVLTIDERPLS